MHFSETDAGHAFHATFIPPAVGKGRVEITVVGRTVATAPKVTEPMVVAASRPTSFRGDQVMEAAPGNTDIIGLVITVEVSVNAILEVAMVDPDMVATLQGQVIIAIDVIGSGSLEGEIAEDDIAAAFHEKDAGTLDGFTVRVVQKRAGKPIDRHVFRILQVDITGGLYATFYIYGGGVTTFSCCIQGRPQFFEGGDDHGVGIIAACRGSLASSEAYGGVRIKGCDTILCSFGKAAQGDQSCP